MFRIEKPKQNIDFYSRSSGIGKLASFIVNHKKISFPVLGVLAVAAGYFVWTHGHLTPGQYKEAVLAAQLESPLPPEWQERYFGKSLCRKESYCGPQADPDRDNFTNYEEFLYFTDPTNPDTDNDSKLDGDEVRDLTNPLSSADGPVEPRDITNLYEYNPYVDNLIQEGLKEVEKGNILSMDQIAQMAAELKEIPEYEDVPFKVVQSTGQEGINKYLDDFAKLLNHMKENIKGSPEAILDSTDKEILNENIETNREIAATMILMDVPEEVFVFHKRFFGAIAFYSLMMQTQVDFLEKQITYDSVQQQTRALLVYYLRFVQEYNLEAEELQNKFNFPLSLAAAN